MTTSRSSADKSARERLRFGEGVICGRVRSPSSEEQSHYEEAWDLRMARLGIDLAELRPLWTTSRGHREDCDRMMRSCIASVEDDHFPHIQMTSSAVDKSSIANNPVYSFKSHESPPQSITPNPHKNNSVLDEPLIHHSPGSDHTLYDHSCDTGTLRPRFNRGFLLNNTCYELAHSQLIKAIIDTGPEPYNTRISSRVVPSAFKPLVITKPRNDQPSAMYNNHCYTSIPLSTLNFSTKTNINYGRQVSAPVDSEMFQKISYPEDLESHSQTLRLKSSKGSMKSVKQVNSIYPASSWTLKGRLQVDPHLSENNRANNKLMSKSMTSDESRLSDNYIKHLTGQEIAGNFIKHSQRPECHIQRTEDRYHMGFNDSRLDMIADSNRPLEEHLWYHPFLSRVASEQLLAKYPEGSFLVRRSESSSNEYSLSIRYKQKWLHMKISRDIDGQFVLGQYSQPYPSIPIMIRHYSCSFLPVKGANLISLQQPVFRL